METIEGALFQDVLDALSDPVILIDGRKVVTSANRAAVKAWPALTVGTPISFTVRAPDLTEALDRVLSGSERLVRGSLVERLPVEKSFEFQVSSLSSRGPVISRTAPAVVIALHDLTESKRLEAMRVDFVANASHELRTPLASLLGFIETLQGPARNDIAAQGRFLTIMREQGRRMARLIDDLLSLSRVEMSEHKRPVDPLDFMTLVRQAADLMQPLAQERKVALTLDGPSSPVMVAGDRDELLRVVENLTENAVKYGQTGGRVELVVTSEMEPKKPCSECQLSVRDYGPGIAAEHLPRLTERFYRVDVSASRETGGTGLGLAIVKHILNRHRGRLGIESEPGKGSTFKVTLPLWVADHSA